MLSKLYNYFFPPQPAWWVLIGEESTLKDKIYYLKIAKKINYYGIKPPEYSGDRDIYRIRVVGPFPSEELAKLYSTAII